MLYAKLPEGGKTVTPEEILNSPALVLTQAQRQQYFEHGYLAAPGLVSAEWIKRLREATSELLDESRRLDASNDRFDLGPDHAPDQPRPRRIRAAVDQHPTYWEFAACGLLTDLAADLVGPDVKFHSSKINFKWPGGEEDVKWHQDIPAWPHSNYSPVTIGVYFEDVTPPHGPLAAIPGSHEGELFDHFDDDGQWTGYIRQDDLGAIALDRADEMTGSAGTVVAVNCRTIHGSRRNLSDRVRPLFLNVYSSADAFTFGPPPTPTSHTGDIVRGKPARWSHNDPRPCRIPPDWATLGYTSIFAAQKQEDDRKRA